MINSPNLFPNLLFGKEIGLLQTIIMTVLKKLTIKPKGGSPIECLFNPAELTISKSNNFSHTAQPRKNIGKTEFAGGQAFSATLQLIFDTTEKHPHSSVTVGENVHTAYIGKLFDLMAYPEGQEDVQPPICELDWGAFKFTWGKDNSYPLKLCVITNVSVDYTLFSADLVPLRATATVSIEQAEDVSNDSQNPTTRTEARRTWSVLEGETLDWIAHQEYGNSAHWRYIAHVNNLANPRRLRPGQVLRLPKLPLEGEMW